MLSVDSKDKALSVLSPLLLPITFRGQWACGWLSSVAVCLTLQPSTTGRPEGPGPPALTGPHTQGEQESFLSDIMPPFVNIVQVEVLGEN